METTSKGQHSILKVKDARSINLCSLTYDSVRFQSVFDLNFDPNSSCLNMETTSTRQKRFLCVPFLIIPGSKAQKISFIETAYLDNQTVAIDTQFKMLIKYLFWTLFFLFRKVSAISKMICLVTTRGQEQDKFHIFYARKAATG